MSSETRSKPGQPRHNTLAYTALITQPMVKVCVHEGLVRAPSSKPLAGAVYKRQRRPVHAAPLHSQSRGSGANRPLSGTTKERQVAELRLSQLRVYAVLGLEAELFLSVAGKARADLRMKQSPASIKLCIGAANLQ